MTTSENHLAVESLVHVFSEWEIQFLVLLSFTLQFFLFLVAGHRQRTTNGFLRFLIWLAYLGADVVAVYALGLLTQHNHATIGTPRLGLLWASFLLIHLGGQDTITAFAIEDNNLWRRHLLTLVVQATLVLYVFWKSIGGPDMQLLVASILLFATGAIKYVERIWALWGGSLKRLASSTVPGYVKEQWTPIGLDARYTDIAYVALHSIRGVRDVFGDIGFYHRSVNHGRGARVHPHVLPKLLEIELSLMFNDIYTKSKVLRTRRGIILRSVSLIFFLVGFVLFATISKKERYNSNDTTITYALFIGGFSLEAYAIFITMMSPWTWAWLKNQQGLHPQGQCSLLVSINMWWQRRGMLWSNSMGQYNLLNYLGQYEKQSSMCKRLVMAVISKAVNRVCGAYQKFWISKLLDTKFVEVDEKIMSCIVEAIVRYPLKRSRQEWPNLGPLLEMLFRSFPFEEVIILMHVYTEVQLSRCYPPGVDNTLLMSCRKLSNYMLYLLATHPEMLPVKKGSDQILSPKQKRLTGVLIGSLVDSRIIDGVDISILHRAVEMLIEKNLPVPQQDCTEARLMEIQEAWSRLLIYAACKSRPEMHAAQLARGGELLTFAWLLTAHHLIGDLGERIDVADIFNMEEAKTVHITAHDKLLYQ